MKQIKFGEDYEKLPEVWVGTTATLIAVYPEKVDTIKKEYTAFWKLDTKVRNQEKYYGLNFEDALILVFLHHNSGRVFSTIRNNKNGEKFEYYANSVGETFMLKSTMMNK